LNFDDTHPVDAFEVVLDHLLFCTIRRISVHVGEDYELDSVPLSSHTRESLQLDHVLPTKTCGWEIGVRHKPPELDSPFHPPLHVHFQTANDQEVVLEEDALSRRDLALMNLNNPCGVVRLGIQEVDIGGGLPRIEVVLRDDVADPIRLEFRPIRRAFNRPGCTSTFRA
jgi:hypothetical protein